MYLIINKNRSIQIQLKLSDGNIMFLSPGKKTTVEDINSITNLNNIRSMIQYMQISEDKTEKNSDYQYTKDSNEEKSEPRKKRGGKE